MYIKTICGELSINIRNINQIEFIEFQLSNDLNRYIVKPKIEFQRLIMSRTKVATCIPGYYLCSIKDKFGESVIFLDDQYGNIHRIYNDISWKIYQLNITKPNDVTDIIQKLLKVMSLGIKYKVKFKKNFAYVAYGNHQFVVDTNDMSLVLDLKTTVCKKLKYIPYKDSRVCETIVKCLTKFTVSKFEVYSQFIRDILSSYKEG